MPGAKGGRRDAPGALTPKSNLCSLAEAGTLGSHAAVRVVRPSDPIDAQNRTICAQARAADSLSGTQSVEAISWAPNLGAGDVDNRSSPVYLPKLRPRCSGASPAPLRRSSLPVSSSLIVAGDYAMMSAHAAATGVPGHDPGTRPRGRRGAKRINGSAAAPP